MRKVILIDFDCIFPNLNSGDVRLIEAELEQDEALESRLAEARMHSPYDGAVLRRVWCWFEGKPTALDEFNEDYIRTGDQFRYDEADPLVKSVMEDMAVLRKRVEKARRPDYYEKLIFADAKQAITDWVNDGFTVIAFGDSYSQERMSPALKKSGIPIEIECACVSRVTEWAWLEQIAKEFDLDLHTASLITRHTFGLSDAAKQFLLKAVVLNRKGARKVHDGSEFYTTVKDLTDFDPSDDDSAIH